MRIVAAGDIEAALVAPLVATTASCTARTPAAAHCRHWQPDRRCRWSGSSRPRTTTSPPELIITPLTPGMRSAAPRGAIDDVALGEGVQHQRHVARVGGGRRARRSSERWRADAAGRACSSAASAGRWSDAACSHTRAERLGRRIERPGRAGRATRRRPPSLRRARRDISSDRRGAHPPAEFAVRVVSAENLREPWHFVKDGFLRGRGRIFRS